MGVPLGGDHYDLYFILQLKRKQSFIWGLLSQIISKNVWCNEVSLSFGSGKMRIHIFRERCPTWSSISVCFLFACALPTPHAHTSTSLCGAEGGTRGLRQAKVHSGLHLQFLLFSFPCEALSSLRAMALVILHPYKADDGIQKSGHKGNFFKAALVWND